MLSACTVEEGTEDAREVKRLLEAAFPPNEQAPFSFLLEQAEREEVSLLAYRDEGLFCGFAFMIEGADLAYVLFLAVDQAARSRGNGARMLEDVGRRLTSSRLTMRRRTPSSGGGVATSTCATASPPPALRTASRAMRTKCSRRGRALIRAVSSRWSTSCLKARTRRSRASRTSRQPTRTCFSLPDNRLGRPWTVLRWRFPRSSDARPCPARGCAAGPPPACGRPRPGTRRPPRCTSARSPHPTTCASRARACP